MQRPEVLLGDAGVVADRSRVAPVAEEPARLRDEEVERGEPVTAEEQDVREVDDAPDVREDGPRLDHVDEAEQAVCLEEARRAQQRVDSDAQLEEVQRQEAGGVQSEIARADVAAGQAAEVVDDQAALEVAGSSLDGDVRHVDEVGQRVGDEPQRLDAGSQLRERLARDARPQIVQHGGRESRHPAEHEPSVRRDDVVAVWRTRG